MFKILILLLLVITSLLPFTAIEAVEVKDLYQASVTINSRNNTDRAIALKEALAAVMVKVGGNKSVLDNKIIKKALIDYQRYLNQYRYQFDTIHTIKPIVDNQTQTKQLFLLASFNEDKINQLFQQANLALWGSLRPQVLLWLVDEDGLVRTIMSNSTDSSLPFMVNNFSAQRGLPIMMPLMDLTDASQITLSDIWGRFEQPVRKASSRYLAEAIVVMRISNSSLLAVEPETNNDASSSNCGLLCTQTSLKEQGYTLDWSLLGWGLKGDQKRFSQQYKGSERQKLLQQGLADITELIYQYYALSTTSNNNFMIEVANIDSLATYVDVFDFLTNLSAVKSVTLLRAEGASRRFNLQLLGSSEALVASLKLNKQLKQFIDPLARINTTTLNNEADEIAVPIFYWGN
ncbi:DUF2066 domain-containing protein [Candidatus Colwellia aromaticivorans]|uniref:DUF2066 domain-containing protein n=1 Tax=Candidatus Colwellia aromaticivorans TaxID=2267621 RepID=UPI000DF1B849|nr:DUF2066 domain-containing protein [Candidatus Colwellia aromaticivorans]